MAIGPVQLIVLGFNHPNVHGEVIQELERLRASDTVRVIDALAVHKDAEGELEVAHLSNLTLDEAVELGTKVGALIGLGIERRGVAFACAAAQVRLRRRLGGLLTGQRGTKDEPPSRSGFGSRWSAQDVTTAGEIAHPAGCQPSRSRRSWS